MTSELLADRSDFTRILQSYSEEKRVRVRPAWGRTAHKLG